MGRKIFYRESIEKYIQERKNNNIIDCTIIHRKKNVGTVKNINRALRISKGEYIKILGGDDAYPFLNTFSDTINVINKNNTIAVVGKWMQCDEKLNPIKDKRLFSEKYGLCDEDYYLIEDITLLNRILKESRKVVAYNEYTVKHRAKGGISSSREMFSPRRLLYYKDCITYAKKDVDKNPEIYTWLFRKDNIRIHEFVYKMTKAKANNKALMLLIIVGYIDSVIYYSCTRPLKLLKRIVASIRAL